MFEFKPPSTLSSLSAGVNPDPKFRPSAGLGAVSASTRLGTMGWSNGLPNG